MNFFKRLFGIKEKEEENGIPKPLDSGKSHRSSSIDDIISNDHSSKVVEEALQQSSEEKPSEKSNSAREKKNSSSSFSNSGNYPRKLRVGNIPLHPNPEEWSTFEKDGKEGYEDENENMMIDAQFDSADNFENGVATVQIADKYGMISPKGEWLLPPVYDFIYGVSDGMVLIEKDKKSGFALPDGTIAIDLQYGYAEEFSEGVAVVSNKEYMRGYIDKNNKTFLPFKFDDAGAFSEGLAHAKLEDGDYGFIDKSGKFVIKPQFESADQFKEGLAPVKLQGLHTWCDKSGKIICEPRYYSAETFSCGFASVQEKKDGKWGLADKTGKLVYDYQFDYSVDFMEDKKAYVFITGECYTLYPDGRLEDNDDKITQAKTP